MYKYKDYNYSLEEVQDAADKEKLSIDEYIKEFNIEKPIPTKRERKPLRRRQWMQLWR